MAEYKDLKLKNGEEGVRYDIVDGQGNPVQEGVQFVIANAEQLGTEVGAKEFNALFVLNDDGTITLKVATKGELAAVDTKAGNAQSVAGAAQATANAAQNTANAALPRTGGTISGPLTVNGVLKAASTIENERGCSMVTAVRAASNIYANNQQLKDGTYGLFVYGFDGTARRVIALDINGGGGGESVYIGTSGGPTIYAQSQMVFTKRCDWESTVYFPEVATTAQAANAYLVPSGDTKGSLRRSTSSETVKTNIQDIAGSGDDKAVHDLEGIIPKTFNSLCDGDDPDKTFVGFSADQIAEVNPNLATLDVDGTPVGYDTNAMLGTLWKGWQLHGERIGQLEGTNAKLLALLKEKGLLDEKELEALI